MKLYREEQGWAERLIASAVPSVTLRSAVPPHLAGFRSTREYAKIWMRAALHPRQTPQWLHLQKDQEQVPMRISSGCSLYVLMVKMHERCAGQNPLQD